jgi:hypothetical protein
MCGGAGKYAFAVHSPETVPSTTPPPEEASHVEQMLTTPPHYEEWSNTSRSDSVVLIRLTTPLPRSVVWTLNIVILMFLAIIATKPLLGCGNCLP